MEWTEVLERPELRKLPYKIETNRYGQVLGTRTSSEREAMKARIANCLGPLVTTGRSMVGCAIDTPEGVKVADVAWGSEAFLSRHSGDLTVSAVPELCVEVRLPVSNEFELTTRRTIYFQHGAHEFWICDVNGTVTFFDAKGEIEESHLFPEFPRRIPIATPN